MATTDMATSRQRKVDTLAMDPKYAGDDAGSLAYLSLNPPPASVPASGLIPEVEEARYNDTRTVLLIFRVLNAIALSTFFQPDEYYQALEPAWQLAFGADSGAWITWEWQNALRSSIQPILLSGIYRGIAILGDALTAPTLKTLLLLWIPKIAMALPAAMGDYYGWMLAERVYGLRSVESTAVFWLTLLSPWQWFVSTRAFSNCLETTLTTVALYYWPWEWLKPTSTIADRHRDAQNMKWSMILAATACVLRPTNLIIWVVMVVCTLPYAKQHEVIGLTQSLSTWGSIVLTTSNALDRFFYGYWTFPAGNFLNFNLTQNLAVFYGQNRPDYYLTEGVPLLLTTYLPFGIIGIYQALTGRFSSYAGSIEPSKGIMRALAVTALALPATLSLISHKEVRFIYPILPILHILLARPIYSFFHSPATFKRLVLGLFVAINIGLAAYLGFIHNRGIVAVTAYLRSEFERRNEAFMYDGQRTDINHITVGVLMPCHSIPWRSHLLYPEIDAWALTCEPPLNFTKDQKKTYVDEADQFYANPLGWVLNEVGTQERPWPMYLVFFAQMEDTFKQADWQVKYHECWRGFNSQWHDDWRRQGDVVVWCQENDNPHEI